MTFLNSLRSQFELIEQLPGEKAIDCYRVRDIRREWAESVVRVLPEKFSADKEIVDRFHSFFTQFSSIPNRTFIPAVYSITGVAGGNVYAVEEYVTGVPLPRFIELRRASETLRADVIEALVKVCEALHHAHQRDIFHLCIAPTDILVDVKNPGRVKLVGFGTQIFITGGRFDSFSDHCKGYIAPEILDGKEPKTSADIYSLATTIRDVFPEIGDYGDLISRGLSRNVADRSARAREFAQSLKELINKKTTLTSDKPKQNTNVNSGGLLPIVQIKSEPIGAEVKLNGKVVGVTSDKGLSLSCARDAILEISKAGFQTETISFPDFGSKPEFTVKLKSAFRLFTNPWGAIVRVDGLEIGVTNREGLVVPWDGHTIEIQKSGYKPETLKFLSPPSETASCLELKTLITEAPTKWDWPKIAPYILAGFLLCLAPILIYNGISKLKASLTSQASRHQQPISQKRQINHSHDQALIDACRAGNVQEVERLLKLGADPESKSGGGFTGLMYAAAAGRLEIAKLLLNYGADVNAVWQGKRADDFAEAYFKKDILLLLQDHRRNLQRSP